MKNLSTIRVIFLLIITVLVLSGTVMAEEAASADVEFAATEAGDGIVELDVTVKNATFRGLQTAVRYNKSVVSPVNESGKDATLFAEFAQRTEESIVFSTAGLLLEADKGLFGFTVFIMPGTTGDNITSNGEYVAEESGVKLFKFRFKKLKDGNPEFEIAFEDETKPYQNALKEGFIISNSEGKHKVAISFVYEEEEPQQTIITPAVDTKPEQPKFTAEDRKKDVICLQIGKNQTITFGKKVAIDPDNENVVPYIVNDRTLVPLRFIAERLGAEVLWEEGWDGCIIKNGDTEIKITFGSEEFTLNGETVIYEAPIEVVHDRTMVPVRFVSEALGQNVYWNEKNSAVVITPEDNPWIEDRETEITALNEMLVTILGVIS